MSHKKLNTEWYTLEYTAGSVMIPRTPDWCSELFSIIVFSTSIFSLPENLFFHRRPGGFPRAFLLLPRLQRTHSMPSQPTGQLYRVVGCRHRLSRMPQTLKLIKTWLSSRRFGGNWKEATSFRYYTWCIQLNIWLSVDFIDWLHRETCRLSLLTRSDTDT